jgi:hypothetical protein
VTLNIPNNAYTPNTGSLATPTGTVTLTFSMTGTAPVIALNATSRAFGDQQVASSSAAQQVTVSNTGTAPLGLAGLSVVGANVADFSIGSDTCSGTIVAVGKSCTAQITFRPGDAGARTATLEILSNGQSAGGMTSVTLTGTGTVGPTSTLTVSIAGAGHGTVSGSGISCPGNCSSGYADGTSVTLSAVAATGSTFAGWSGGCSGTGSCTVTISADQTITATFATATGPGRTPAPSCTLTAGKPRSGKHGTQLIALIARCDQAAQLKLTGRLTTIRIVRRHHHKRVATLPARRVSIGAGTPLTITVPVLSKALRALGSHVHETAAFTLTASNSNGVGSAIAQLALKRIRRRLVTSPLR